MTDPTADAIEVRRGAGLVEARTGDELVGLHIENGTCYAFNSTAARIWELIEAPKTLAELRDTLTAEFEVNPETCETEVRTLLDDLARDGLVQLA